MNEITVSISQDLHTHLTAYLDLGLPVIPVCPPTTKGMSLTLRQKYGDSPDRLGKQPLIKGWVDKTSTTYEELNSWLSKFKHCNFGLPMGNASGIVGVDIDGDLGEKLLQEWSKGDLPQTWSFTTRAGRRILYAVPKGMKVTKYKETSKDAIHEELALLGDGQQTVIPPSIHREGAVYEWDEGFSPWDIPLPAMAPKWVLDRMCEANTQTVDDNPEYSEAVTETEWKTELTEGNRSQQLVRLAGSLAARGNLPRDAILEFLRTWNTKNCRPPLADEELQRMVDYVVTSEANSKHAQRRKQKEDELEFLPDPITEKIIEAEASKGYIWKYLSEKMHFYVYDNTQGYWRTEDVAYVKQRVRRYLIATEPKWGTTQKIREIIEAMKEQLMDPLDSDRFDISKNPATLLNLRNGMLNMTTGTLEVHDPSHYSFIQLPISWDVKAKCPAWMQAYEEWLPDAASRLFLQEYIGYCLTHDTSFKTAVFLNGGGNNGKSLFLHGISEMFGEEARTAIPLHALSDRFTPAQLQNKLVNVCDELDTDHIGKTGIIKAIISGDPIKAEYKYGASFNFTPVAKLIFSTNTLPRATDRSEGWYSRLRIVDFPNKFAPSKVYRQQMHADIQEELAGMLVWAVEGLSRLQEQGQFTLAAEMQKAGDAYRNENDSVSGFASECLEVAHGTKDHLPTADVYMFYRQYCEDNGLKAVAKREFTTRMKTSGFTTGSRHSKLNYTKRHNCFLDAVIAEDFRGEYNLIAALSIRQA